MKHGGKEKTKADHPPLRQLASTFYPMVVVKICERLKSATRVVILLGTSFFQSINQVASSTPRILGTILNFRLRFQTYPNLFQTTLEPLKSNDDLLWRLINNSIVKEGNKKTTTRSRCKSWD